MSFNTSSKDYLSQPLHELQLGKIQRHYRVDKSHQEFYFFAKCPEEVLDVEVYEIPNGELHVVDTHAPSPKRFMFLKEKDDALLDAHVIVMNFNDGFVYASRSCRFVLR